MAYYHITFPFFKGRVIALEEGFPLGYSSGHPIAASDVMTWPGLRCRALSLTKWVLPEWEQVVESPSHLAWVWNMVNLPFLLWGRMVAGSSVQHGDLHLCHGIWKLSLPALQLLRCVPQES